MVLFLCTPQEGTKRKYPLTERTPLGYISLRIGVFGSFSVIGKCVKANFGVRKCRWLDLHSEAVRSHSSDFVGVKFQCVFRNHMVCLSHIRLHYQGILTKINSTKKNSDYSLTKSFVLVLAKSLPAMRQSVQGLKLGGPEDR